MIKENYKPKIQALENVCRQWERRTLTPLGKITLIKVLMIPILNHLFFTLPTPEEFVINNINNILYNFLWGSKALIKKECCYKTV